MKYLPANGSFGGARPTICRRTTSFSWRIGVGFKLVLVRIQRCNRRNCTPTFGFLLRFVSSFLFSPTRYFRTLSQMKTKVVYALCSIRCSQLYERTCVATPITRPNQIICKRASMDLVHGNNHVQLICLDAGCFNGVRFGVCISSKIFL